MPPADQSSDRWPWGQPIDGVIQVAHVVPDLAASMTRYARLLDIGPWYCFEDFAFERAAYRGEPMVARVSLALGFSGTMMFELIQPLDNSPSPYRETIDKRGYGFHHFGLSATPQSFDATVARLQDEGSEIVLDAVVGAGSRAMYLRHPLSHDDMVEVIEVTPTVETLFGDMAAAARTPANRREVRTPMLPAKV